MYDLTPGERSSALWRRLEEYLNERLTQARFQLEGPIGLDETNRVRGKIIELKALLRLGQDKPNVV